MKILAIHSIGVEDKKRESAIDFWRVFSPLQELKKHVDWQIDYQPTFLPGSEEYSSPEDFDEVSLEQAAARLGQYDIIFSSYQPNPFVFSLLQSVKKRYGTKYILDDDDDVFSIEPDNPFWMKANQTDVEYMQQMIRLSDYICTTTKPLASMYEYQSKAKVFTIPNYISERYQNDVPKDSERINIGYFGGAAHYNDLHETNILPALEKLMHENKNIHFTTVGVPLDGYLPRARVHHIEAGNIDTWLNTIYPSLNFDICIAPLRVSTFSEGKSNIKWQEATRMGAAFVGSNVGPYRVLDKKTALTANNVQADWYIALSKALDPTKRRKLVENAQAELADNWTMENNWEAYKKMFETVKLL